MREQFTGCGFDRITIVNTLITTLTTRYERFYDGEFKKKLFCALQRIQDHSFLT
jgi:hypothetical protein